MATAGLLMGLESIVETWVSIIESHSTKTRNLSQKRLEEEAMIAINGPEVVHCDEVVKEALAAYWADARRVGDRQGHWVRRSSHINAYTVSKSVDALVNQAPEAPIMAE